MGLKNPPLVITVYHYLARFVLPIGDPRDGFFFPTLKLIMDSYSHTAVSVVRDFYSYGEFQPSRGRGLFRDPRGQRVVYQPYTPQYQQCYSYIQ